MWSNWSYRGSKYKIKIRINDTEIKQEVVTLSQPVSCDKIQK